MLYCLDYFGGGMQAIGKWQQNTSWTSLLAGLLVVIGLTCAGIWTNVLGYSTSLFAPDGIGYPTSSAFLQGRLVISVVLVVLARQIHKQWHWLVAVTGFVMCLVTCCAVLAPSQGMFDPQTLSHISIVCGSMGYTILTTSFYIVLAEHVEVRPSALVIAVSLALETVFSVLVSTQVTALGQAVLVLVAPVLSGLAFQLGYHLLAHGPASSSHPDVHEKSYPPRSRRYAFLRLLAFTVALVCIRALSEVGIWGRERENFIGMSELSGTELVLVTSFVLAASVAAFILPRRLSNVARSIIGFVIVLVGLQLLALSDDPLFGSSFDWIIESCELFSHLLMWMTFIECVRETDMPAFRISGLRSLAYVGTTMLFDRYLDDPTIATSTVIIVVVYVLFVIVLVPLAIWLRPWQSGRSDEVDQTDKEGALPGESRSTERQDEQQSQVARFAGHHGLSPRESEILGLLLAGKTYATVTEETGLSEGTVRTHISSIYRKLDVHSKGEAGELFEAFCSSAAASAGEEAANATLPC